MGINTLAEVWQKLLALIVISLVLFWVYKNMHDTAFKRWISETITKIKEAFKDGE